MLIGYFDYLIIGILIFLNIKFWNKYDEKNVGCIGIISLFGFILPLISMLIELVIVSDWIDSFEVVYTYSKFPIYWIIGFFQMIIMIINLSIKPEKQNESDKIE